MMVALVSSLRSEHQRLLRLLPVVERQVHALDSCHLRDADLLLGAMTYLGRYMKLVHEPKEAVLLEVALRRAGPARCLLEPIVRAGHEEFSAHRTRFTTLLNAAVGGNVISRAHLVRTGVASLDALRSQIAHEERATLPWAQKQLTAGDRREIQCRIRTAHSPHRVALENAYEALYERLMIYGTH